MGRVWVTSDFHINHNREFIYKPRGFNNIGEMNEAIISNTTYRSLQSSSLINCCNSSFLTLPKFRIVGLLMHIEGKRKGTAFKI